jgi:small subunit ribosomal protein S5
VLLKLKVVELGFCIVVVGDENGVVGHGLGKSKDVSETQVEAKNPLNGLSVPHEQKGNGGRVYS